MNRVGASAAVVLGLLCAMAMSAPASADAVDDHHDDDIATVIVDMIAEIPGGIIVAPDRAVWPELGMELTVPGRERLSFRAAVGSCATGKVCVYTGSALSGARLSWTTCGVLPIPSSFTARSIADARSAGYAQARHGTTVLATAAANAWANVGGSATNVRCVF